MSDASAIKVAVALLHMPSRVEIVRSQSLPAGILLVLRVAVGDDKAIAEAAAVTERSREVVTQAAAFFIEQILLTPGSNAYRTLGAHPDASRSELRSNMALLLRWLHPDIVHNGDRSIFVGRVTGAWESLKTRERRAHYDLDQNCSASTSGSRRDHKSSRHPSPHAANGRYLMPSYGMQQRPGQSWYRVTTTRFLRQAFMRILGRN